jgi:hypothetical protein
MKLRRCYLRQLLLETVEATCVADDLGQRLKLIFQNFRKQQLHRCCLCLCCVDRCYITQLLKLSPHR